MPNARHRTRDLTRGLRALAALAVLLAGLPAVLVALGHQLLDSSNPLTGLRPPWDWEHAEIIDALTRAVDQDTIITTLARAGLLVAWAALAVLATNVAVEYRVQRSTGESLRMVRGLGWSHAIAVRVAAGLLALSTFVPQHLASADALPARHATVSVQVRPGPTAPTPLSTAPNDAAVDPNWVPYQVARGDSVYGIAARLADGDRAHARDIAEQILARNLGRVMVDGQRFATPGYIEIGWILDLPATPDPTSPALVPASEPAASRTVQPGDCYWDIAEAHLNTLLDTEPSNAQVLAHTHELIATNAARLGPREPVHLLHPGDVLTLTPPATIPAAFEPPSVAAVPAETTPPAPPPETAVPIQPPATPPPATTPASTPTPIDASTIAPPLTPPAAEPPAGAEREPDADDDEAPALNPWAPLAISALFATGMTATVIRLRRRRLAHRHPGNRLAPTPREARLAEIVLHAEAQPDRITGLRQVLAVLTGRTRRPTEQGALVRAVQLGDDIELLWSAPQPFPPPGWTSHDGGASWHHPHPNTNTGQELRCVLPTLVSVGHRDADAELLLDLEAAGTLAITGDPATARGLVHQLVLTLATSPLADDTLEIVCVGIDPPAVSHLDRARVCTLRETLGWVTARTAEHHTILTARHTDSTFQARLAGREHDTFSPIVVALDTGQIGGDEQEMVDELIDRCAPGSGAALVLLGDHPAVRDRIDCARPDHAFWTSTGVGFTPAVLSTETADAIDQLVDHAADADEHPTTLSVTFDEQPASCGMSMPLTEGTDLPAARDDESTGSPLDDPPYDVLVRVLGEVVVEGCASHLTEAEIELLALLASLRPAGPINIDRLATLVAHDEWRTPKPRSVQSRLSYLRTKLGLGGDLAPLLPDTRAGNNSPGRYSVSPLVQTDVDLLQARYASSHALPSGAAIAALRNGLELIRGRPYCARTGYTWATDEHAVQRAHQAVVDTTARLIDLCGQANDPRGVLWAVHQANRAIDDPMSQLPYRRLEAELALTTTDAGLTASALNHRRQLQTYLDDEDPVGALDPEYEDFIAQLARHTR